MKDEQKTVQKELNKIGNNFSKILEDKDIQVNPVSSRHCLQQALETTTSLLENKSINKRYGADLNSIELSVVYAINHSYALQQNIDIVAGGQEFDTETKEIALNKIGQLTYKVKNCVSGAQKSLEKIMKKENTRSAEQSR